MNDTKFEKLEKAIRQKTLELDCLQELYVKETGHRYIPASYKTTKNSKLDANLLNSKENMRKYCTAW